LIFTVAICYPSYQHALAIPEGAIFIAVELGLGGGIIEGQGLYVKRFFSLFAFKIVGFGSAGRVYS
jgi:hypothetical protein